MPDTHDVRFPNEGRAYRTARDRLLKDEVALMEKVWSVAAQRAALPLGGEVPQDYVFEEAGGKKVKLSQLFAPGKDSLILYNFMYGPKMKEPCPMCTSILDGLEGQVEHVTQRVNFAVVARSPIARIRAFARSRGWRRHRLLSSAKNTFNRDYRGEDAAGDQWPACNVFVRRGKKIHHFYATEVLFLDRGHESCHVDMIWPLWNMFDLVPEGRGTDWYPKVRYPKTGAGKRTTAKAAARHGRR